jgi:hypothetical protein
MLKKTVRLRFATTPRSPLGSTALTTGRYEDKNIEKGRPASFCNYAEISPCNISRSGKYDAGVCAALRRYAARENLLLTKDQNWGIVGSGIYRIVKEYYDREGNIKVRAKK